MEKSKIITLDGKRTTTEAIHSERRSRRIKYVIKICVNYPKTFSSRLSQYDVVVVVVQNNQKREVKQAFKVSGKLDTNRIHFLQVINTIPTFICLRTFSFPITRLVVVASPVHTKIYFHRFVTLSLSVNLFSHSHSTPISFSLSLSHSFTRKKLTLTH